MQTDYEKQECNPEFEENIDNFFCGADIKGDARLTAAGFAEGLRRKAEHPAAGG